ncbi:hypothetical protein P2G88_08025, partial [Aliiglaciecola sp. CAU 1673]|uniref:hypothetical protein n=1 Tax=Aliiglaciecola sp. CAU 1673 TaxID=3032595 RepID=UPI0023DC2B64
IVKELCLFRRLDSFRRTSLKRDAHSTSSLVCVKQLFYLFVARLSLTYPPILTLLVCPASPVWLAVRSGAHCTHRTKEIKGFFIKMMRSGVF